MSTRKPPDLIRLYVKSVGIGFAAAAGFVGLLLYFDVAGLWRLISGSDMGLVALAMMWIFNGIVFSGVQFGLAIMGMADRDDDDDDGPKGKVWLAEPVPVRVGPDRG
ncbi:MAG: hypothetical protein HLUCCA08_05880 [Rhodobacteraceae bacterium HLUCCA08]|nr:MAG: hypothetical protein HLUCCA08_05880 [Rhodobacteraceae bacterium HLUCCA08]